MKNFKYVICILALYNKTFLTSSDTYLKILTYFVANILFRTTLACFKLLRPNLTHADQFYTPAMHFDRF